MSDLNITAPITETKTLTIRGDWSSNYSFIDDPKTKTVRIQIYGRSEVVAQPALPALAAIAAKPADDTHLATPGRAARAAKSAVTAVAPTQPLTFVLWSGAAYDAAQALNAPNGYGTPDLNNAIAAFLAKQSS